MNIWVTYGTCNGVQIAIEIQMELNIFNIDTEIIMN